jgi:kynurenine/2-aminoadipate aminotransferase
MFSWITIPSIPDSAKIVATKCIDKKVLLVPGHEFYANPTISSSVRAAFSISTLEEMDMGLGRLKEIIKDERNHK